MGTLEENRAKFAAELKRREARAKKRGIPFPVSFNSKLPQAQAAARKHALGLIKDIKDETEDALRVLIERSIRDGVTPEQSARLMRGILLRDGTFRGGMAGLNARQVSSVMNFREQLINSGITTARVNSSVAKLQEKKIRERAKMISRTEGIDALNRGVLTSWEEGVSEGFIDPAKSGKRWIVTPDDRLCPICAPIPFQGAIPFKASFQTSVGAKQTPTAHPNCRCAMGMAPLGERNIVAAVPIFDKPASAFVRPNPNAFETADQFRLANGQYLADRQELHDEIIRVVMGDATSVENPEALILGGGAASGKSSIGSQGVKFSKNRVHLDVDDMRNFLPEYRDALEAGFRDAASLVHEEISAIGKEIQARVAAARMNIILDGTGDGSLESLTKKIEQFRDSGFKIIGQYMTLDTDEAVFRMFQRGEETGRFVPVDLMRLVHAKVSEVFPQAMRAGLFDEVSLFDNRFAFGTPAVRIATAGRDGQITILEQAFWDEFLAKATPRTGEGFAMDRLFDSLLRQRFIDSTTRFPMTADSMKKLFEVYEALPRSFPAYEDLFKRIKGMSTKESDALFNVSTLMDAWTRSPSNIGARKLFQGANNLFGRGLPFFIGGEWNRAEPRRPNEEGFADQYAITQNILRSFFPGGKITLYRGIKGRQATDALRSGVGGRKFTFQTNALSSWTTSFETASTSAFTSVRGGGTDGAVITTEVDIEDVFALLWSRKINARMTPEEAAVVMAQAMAAEQEFLVYGDFWGNSTSTRIVEGGE